MTMSKAAKQRAYLKRIEERRQLIQANERLQRICADQEEELSAWRGVKNIVALKANDLAVARRVVREVRLALGLKVKRDQLSSRHRGKAMSVVMRLLDDCRKARLGRWS